MSSNFTSHFVLNGELIDVISEFVHIFSCIDVHELHVGVDGGICELPLAVIHVHPPEALLEGGQCLRPLGLWDLVPLLSQETWGHNSLCSLATV